MKNTDLCQACGELIPAGDLYCSQECALAQGGDASVISVLDRITATPDYTAAAGAWGEDALKGEKAEDAVRRLRDGLSAPVAPPKPPLPKVELRFLCIHDNTSLNDSAASTAQRYAAEGFRVVACDDGFLVMQRINEGA